jgi:hypothetical protein
MGNYNYFIFIFFYAIVVFFVELVLQPLALKQVVCRKVLARYIGGIIAVQREKERANQLKMISKLWLEIFLLPEQEK